MAKKFAFILISITLAAGTTFALAEMGYRLFKFGLGPQAFMGFSREPVENLLSWRFPVQVDQHLGWIPSAKFNDVKNNVFFHGFDVNILDDTTRSNGPTPPLSSDCRWLAVGDSFTFGDEVNDSQTWPAQLERQMKCRVFNGGVPAYGIDQSYLRALELMEKLQPQVIFLSLIWDDVWRAGQDIRQGMPKPYYTLENGQLVYNKIPDFLYKSIEDFAKNGPTRLQKYIKISYLLQLIAQHFTWTGQQDRLVENHREEVACALVKDLDQKARAKNIQFYLVAQYYDDEYIHMNSEMPTLFKCLAGSPVKIIDTFPAVKEREQKNELYKLYFHNFSHMTEVGNGVIAGVVAQRLLDDKIKR